MTYFNFQNDRVRFIGVLLLVGAVLFVAVLWSSWHLLFSTELFAARGKIEPPRAQTALSIDTLSYESYSIQSGGQENLLLSWGVELRNTGEEFSAVSYTFTLVVYYSNGHAETLYPDMSTGASQTMYTIAPGATKYFGGMGTVYSINREVAPNQEMPTVDNIDFILQQQPDFTAQEQSRAELWAMCKVHFGICKDGGVAPKYDCNFPSAYPAKLNRAANHIVTAIAAQFARQELCILLTRSSAFCILDAVQNAR